MAKKDKKPVNDPLKELQKIIRQYLKENQQDVATFGRDAVLGILFQETMMSAPIPPLDPQADMKAIAQREKILAGRDKTFEMVTEAHKMDSERVARLQASSQNTVLRLLNLGMSTVFGAILGSL